jgi:hypothetical protein
MNWTGLVTEMELKRNAYRILVGKPERRRRLRSRCRWVGNIKMYIREIGLDGLDCTDVARNRD